MMLNVLKKSLLGVLAATPLFLCAQPATAPLPQGQNPKGMHVYLWTGLKSHGEGKHDYPQFLADWSKVLTEHGAVVDGSLHAPTAADLEHTDVVVLYKGDAGFLTDTTKAALDAFIKRGGGFADPALYLRSSS